MRPDHSKSLKKIAAIAEDKLPDGESTSEHGENDDPETEEEQEGGEIDDTPQTTSQKTTGTSSPGMEGAWVLEHLREHAMAGTSPQKWVIDLFMGPFGRTPADYPHS